MVESPQHLKKRIGIDISNTGLTAVIVDSDDAIEAVRTIEQSEIEDSVAGVTKLVEGLRSEKYSFDTIGVAVPGLIDKKTNRVAFSANFPGHSDVDLVREV